jgi:hypothetical protein
MTTTSASVKLSQANAAPDEHHFHGVKHIKYLYIAQNDGIYFWRMAPFPEFKEGPLPTINSNKQDLLIDNQPQHNANIAHAFADLSWATCVKTQHLFVVM